MKKILSVPSVGEHMLLRGMGKNDEEMKNIEQQNRTRFFAETFLAGAGKLSHPFSKTLPHSLPSSQHRNNSFTTSTSTVATDDGDAGADDADDDADADVNDAADNDKRNFYKVTTTLVHLLLIKLKSHLSNVKQMYSQPMN